MKISIEELQELYKWAKSLEDIALMTAYINSKTNELKRDETDIGYNQKADSTKEELSEDDCKITACVTEIKQPLTDEQVKKLKKIERRTWNGNRKNNNKMY